MVAPVSNRFPPTPIVTNLPEGEPVPGGNQPFLEEPIEERAGEKRSSSDFFSLRSVSLLLPSKKKEGNKS